MSPLLVLILLPVLGALFCFFAPKSARHTALWAATLNTILSVSLLLFFKPAEESGYGYLFFLPVLEKYGINFFLGADGFSLVMLLLSAVVTLAAVWSSKAPDKMPGLYYGGVLLISAGVLGAFASVDIFFFYLFHELALIPTFLLIGIWGTGDRQRIAWKITIYLAFGSFLLLLGLIGLYLAMPAEVRTFDMRVVRLLAEQGMLQPHLAVYFLLLLGFGILVSLFPFHTWAPAAYASAPAPVAMLHAGVLKKFGLYGLFRLVLPVFPAEVQAYAPLLLALIVGNILYIGYVTMAQKRLDLMAGYSSVMHMGYIFLGFAAGVLSQMGSSGAVLLMLGHGLSVAALFALIGQLRERTGTMEFSELGGLGRVLPKAGLLFGLATMASLGLPGFANFAGEVMVFFGAVAAGGHILGNPFQLTTLAAVWGVVISAVYGLRAYRAVFFGEMPDRWKSLEELPLGTRLSVLLLLLCSLAAGFYPQMIIQLITPAVLVP